MATDIAFALAGLGGFNAHGAGFLTAARDLQVKPDIITATSGQIIVLAEWLRGADLEKLLVKPASPDGPLGMLLTTTFGEVGVFKPAVMEYLERWRSIPTSMDDLSAAMFPAQRYKPVRSEAYLAEMAEVLNGASMGVVFNAYEPKSGDGKLFGNDAARSVLAHTTLAAIDGQAISSALWLPSYGFETMPGGLMDGAFDRFCIIAELAPFDQIYAVRPLDKGWRDCVPSTTFDAQDWQTEMSFIASYKAEVSDMKRINTLIDRGLLRDQCYKKIDLIEISTDKPAGFFNFFHERHEVFVTGYEKGLAALRAGVR